MPTSDPDALPRRPAAPKRQRGALRALNAGEFQDEEHWTGRLIEGHDLQNTALNAAAFQGCVFRGVSLRSAHWRGVRLTDVQFEDCDLSGALREEASLTRVTFSNCRLMGLRLPEARLRDVLVSGSQAALSFWFRADARHLWLDHCDLTEASFQEARLPGAVFRGCRLSRSDFQGALLEDADLRGSDLHGTRLGLREVAGVTVEPVQLLVLSSLLGVHVRALDLDQ
ncbi:pentapeptide repeat-containing protein [Deinococcus navajonensis]|uniref:Pentapeptide repeat-containing protein n=1 Tax=Deinococcus navajonensis TaxID=309884 RepID=A0ABV8XLK6_9DEIO